MKLILIERKSRVRRRDKTRRLFKASTCLTATVIVCREISTDIHRSEEGEVESREEVFGKGTTCRPTKEEVAADGGNSIFLKGSTIRQRSCGDAGFYSNMEHDLAPLFVK